jgi:hypothetical protein
MRTKTLIIALLITFSLGVKAAENISGAQAMYIYNFLRHINWPENAVGEKFIIGVYGTSETYDQLVSFTKDRKIGTKIIEVIKVSNTEEASKCQLLFIPFSKSSKIAEIKSSIGNKSCLIVSEKSGTLDSGSAIEFMIVNDRLKFKISEANAKQQRLEVSKALMDMSA